MGLEVISWSSVTTNLTSFYGAPIVAGGLAAMFALGIGGFGLYSVLRAFKFI